MSTEDCRGERVGRKRKEAECLSCSRTGSAGCQKKIPMCLVVGVSCFYCSNLSEKSENARGGHRGLRTIKGACVLGCICSLIKTGTVSQVKFCVYSVCERFTCKEVWWWGPDLSDVAEREATASVGVLSFLFFFSFGFLKGQVRKKKSGLSWSAHQGFDHPVWVNRVPLFWLQYHRITKMLLTTRYKALYSRA